MKTYVVCVTALFAVFGTLQTILATFQLARMAPGVDHVARFYKHPYVMALAMSIGSLVCLPIHLVNKVEIRSAQIGFVQSN